MCGIVGTAGFVEAGLVARMCAAIVHRGPDSSGLVELPEERLAIGMQRLSIIDLATGDQPMVAAGGRVHVVFNGEIYNFREVRAELERAGDVFRTSSDTEVVLMAFLRWGNDAWSRLHGMFAVAVADRRGAHPRILVVRDRVGMKPLYYVHRAGNLVFASEMKALLAWSGLRRDVDLAAVRDYLALRYVPGSGSLFRDVAKLPAGHVLEFARGEIEVRPWWKPPNAVGNKASIEPNIAADRIGDALRAAVRRHMIADVPLGAFLSGGIDSSTIVALMSEVSSVPVKTFSIGFPGFAGDERSRARITADALGTDHHEIECSPAELTKLSDIAWHLDEPVGDAIVVPMSVLSREARRSVKVVLSGEGADEILGGYMFHRKLTQIEQLRRRLPRMTWTAASAVVERVPPALLGRLFDYPGELGIQGRHKVAQLLRSVGTDGLDALYCASVSPFDSSDLHAGCLPALAPLIDRPVGPPLGHAGSATPLQQLVDFQYNDWLPDDILMKADKMSMAHSLEARIPFMDMLVIEAAAALPDRNKLGPGSSKRALRDFARRLLPREIVDTPKQAFYIPLESYMSTPEVKGLVDWALAPQRLKRRGLFRPEWVRHLLEPSRDAGFLLLKRAFSILMLELWFERFAPDATWA